MKLTGRKIYPGFAQGEALVAAEAISFFGGVDPQTGLVVERGHPLEGQSVAGKVLVFPTGKGSTVGSYTLYRLKANGLAPQAIVNSTCEPITAVGCIIAEIPCVDQIDLKSIQNGQVLAVNGEAGQVEIIGPARPPDPLRGEEPGSFAEYTMRERLPRIARKVLETGRWSPQAQQNLQGLIEDLPHGAMRNLRDPGAPDLHLWEAWCQPFLGLTWLEAPWFPAEVYFFRRIVEATRYFQPGPDQGSDPYQAEKSLANELALNLLAKMDQALVPDPAGKDPQTLARLLHTVIWGNQADLSIWPVGEDQPANHEGEQRVSHLLVDHANEAAEFIFNQGHGLKRVDFILDNVGLELAYDLLLSDNFLRNSLAEEIFFHAKRYPTYVSDATIADIRFLIDQIKKSKQEPIRNMGQRLSGFLAEGQLNLSAEEYWISPLTGWEMAAEMRAELGKSDLLISKGDANYRRWVGDRHWPADTPIEYVLGYRPAPLLLLRVLKSELIAGLQPGQAQEMFARDPEWMFNGNWGLIQFVR